MHFDTTGTQSSFVHSTTTSLFSRYTKSLLRSLLEAANQSDAAPPVLSLSRLERCGSKTLTRHTPNKKQSQNENSHITHTDYILVSTGPSAQRMSPRPNKATDLYIAGP